ncbi:armadillo-type protein [Schizophyllum fasciatum]
MESQLMEKGTAQRSAEVPPRLLPPGSSFAVPLRPLWKPAANALVALAARAERIVGQSVWQVIEAHVFADEYVGAAEDSADLEGSGFALMEDVVPADRISDLDKENDSEEERTWRDPAAHWLRVAARLAATGADKGLEITQDDDVRRFDPRQLEEQLLGVFARLPGMIQIHGRAVVKAFLARVGDSSRSTPRPVFLAWLRLFSACHAPRSLPGADAVYAALTDALARPDTALQVAALNALAAFWGVRGVDESGEDDKAKGRSRDKKDKREKQAGGSGKTRGNDECTAWVASLRALLDETRASDELARLSANEEVEDVMDDDSQADVDVVARLLPKDTPARIAFTPLLVRVLFGRLRTRGRRSAALLGALPARGRGLLVGLMVKEVERGWTEDVMREGDRAARDKRAAGFLTLLGDVLTQLGARLVPYWPALLHVVVRLGGDAESRLLRSKADDNEEQDEAEAEGEGERAAEQAISAEESSPSRVKSDAVKTTGHDGRTARAAARNVRALSLRRLAQFFQIAGAFVADPSTPDTTPALTAAVRAAYPVLLGSRISRLPLESTQAPGALLDILGAWAGRKEWVGWLAGLGLDDISSTTDTPLRQLLALLVAPAVKFSVILRVFDVIEGLLSSAEAEEEDTADGLNVKRDVLMPYMHLLLDSLAAMSASKDQEKQDIHNAPSGTKLNDKHAVDALLARRIRILAAVSMHCSPGSQATALARLTFPLLRMPTKQVPERVKADLLRIVCNALTVAGRADNVDEMDVDHATRKFNAEPLFLEATFAALAPLFQSLRSRAARIALVDAFAMLASLDESLRSTSGALTQLNAYSKRRVDEPDIDKRLTALGALGETGWKTLGVREWTPILHHLFHAIQDPEEMAMRTSTAQVLQRFIDATAGTLDDEDTLKASAFRTLFKKVFYPGIRNGLRTRSDAVRNELLGLLSYAVDRAESTPALARAVPALGEMAGLRAGGDAEASFFNNILHVQSHRRARALRRLADYCDSGDDGICPLRSGTLAEVFVPLVAHFIVPTGQGVDHHVVNDAILCKGRMSRHLAWGAYYGLVLTHMRQARASEGKDAGDKVFIRALVAVLDGFHFPMDEDVEDVDAEAEDPEREETGPTEDIDSARSRRARIADIVNAKLLPALIDHLENRHATTEDGARLPIAPGIAAVAAHLPTEKRNAQMSRLLTVLSQVFRSKSQDTRDAARDALIKIVTQLGPPGLPLVVRELRDALRRGPQLHTLAYVVHALLVHVCARAEFTNVDAVAADAAHIAAEVVFGTSGRDVESDGFRTKMREVKGSASKGLDTFALVAQHVTPSAVSTVLGPVRGILHETSNARSLQQVDDVLRRVASGLNANKHLTPPELLVLCHTLISQNAKFLKDVPAKRTKKAKGDAIVQVKRQVDKDEDHYTSNSFRFVAFGLDLLHTALRRNRFDLQDKDTVTRLDAIIPTVGNTLYSTSASVLLAGMKAATGLTKCPLPSLPKSLPVYTRQMLVILKNLGTTESDVAQTALRSLSTIMRDSPGATMQEKDLAFLLELIAPDLEEPERQGAVFAMLRAIVTRRFVVPELYDQMQRVSEVMITSQAPQVREACRGVLLQFLLDYPQGKGRLKNTMAFLAKNLSYVHESGRLSVLELLGAVVAKFQLGLVREYSELLFVALVMVIANDESAKCREGAATLIKALVGRMDDEGRRTVNTHAHAWAAQADRPSLVRVAMQVYGMVVEVLHAEARLYLKAILSDGNQALERSAEQILGAGDEIDTSDLDWQVPYHAMALLSKLAREFPDLLQDDQSIAWEFVTDHLLFPHSWVRMAACRLLGALYAVAPPTSPPPLLDDRHATTKPLSLQGMQEVARLLCLQLKSGNLDDAHALQIVKNLLYAAKSFDLVATDDSREVEEGANEGDSDEAEAEEEDEDNLEHAPLPWLFSRLSYQARSVLIANSSATSRMNQPKWYLQLQSILQWFAAMTTHLDASRLERFLPHILNPLYRITQDEGIRDPQMDELKTLATEVQTLVQSKVAPTAFTAVYSKIRENVRGVQQERKIKRTLLAATNPERAAKRKTKKNESKKESRKRKNATFA